VDVNCRIRKADQKDMLEVYWRSSWWRQCISWPNARQRYQVTV